MSDGPCERMKTTFEQLLKDTKKNSKSSTRENNRLDAVKLGKIMKRK